MRTNPRAVADPAASRTAAPTDTRSRILDAALELFSEHGFDGTTLQQIADKLGFTKAALYYYFRSKDDLLQALVTPAVDDLESLLSAYKDPVATPAKRRRFMEDYVDYLLRQRRLIAYMVRDLATVAHPAIATGAAERSARIETMLAGKDLDFREQVRVTMAFRGIGGVIAQYPEADSNELRAALLETARVLLPARRRASRPSKSLHP